MKVNPTAGSPTIHTWGRLRLQANGGSLAEEQLARHPKVRPLIRTFLGADQTYLKPSNPMTFTTQTRAEQAAIRLAELTQDAVDLGADESSLAFFIQAFGQSTGVALTTPDLFRSQDDAAGIADAGDNYNAIYTGKAENGTLTVQSTLSPVATVSANLRDLCKARLQDRSLTAWGHWLGDTESLHEPWNWCKTSGGVWSDMENDARAGTEVLITGTHFITGTSPGDLTLDAWISRCIANRNANFAPSSNVSWASGTNASTGSHKEMVRLRMEAATSQYTRMTKGIWAGDAFYTGMKFYNYEMNLVNNASYPITTFGGGGSGNVDHTVEFFGLDGSSPILYPYNTSAGELDPVLARFGPTPARAGTGRLYDERRMFNNARRTLGAIHKSTGSLPVFPWVRAPDERVSAVDEINPNPTTADLTQMIRICASYDNCLNLIFWYNDNPAQATPDHATMLAAVTAFYPEYAWTGSDWEAA